MSEASRSAQPDPRPAPPERRAAVRHACERAVTFQSVAGVHDVRWPARVRDLSAAGICLVVSRRFEPGTLLTIDLPDATGEPSVTLLARVVRINWQAGGDWALGCAFATRLSDEELRVLLGG